MNFDAVLRLVAKVDGLEQLDKVKGVIGGVEGAAKDARKAFMNVASSATWQAAAVGAAAITAGLVASVRVAMDFEKSMSAVAAKTGAGQEEMRRLTETAKDLGRTTQFSAKEVADGMDFLAMAGFKTNEILAAMPGLLDLAAAGNLELATAADIVSNILGGMNMEASETGRVADVLAKAATTSNVSVEMLGETFKFVAPVAAQAGVGLEEVAAAAGLLGDAGIQGSEAGTGLRSVLLRLAAPPTEAAKALDRLGVSTKDSAGNMRPFGDILSDVDRRMKELNLGSADQLQIQNALFGKTAIATGAILQQAAANGTLSAKTQELMNSQGAAAEMAEVMNDNLAGAFKRLQSAIQDFQIELTEGNNKALQGFVEGLAKVINKVTDLMKEFPELTTLFVVIAGAASAFVLAAPFIAASFSVLASIGKVLAGLKLGAIIAGWAPAIVKGLAVIIAAFKVAAAGILAIITGPVGLTVLLIAGIVAMAIAFREPIMKFFGWFVEAARNGIGRFREAWLTGWNGVLDFIRGVFSTIATLLYDNTVGRWLTVGRALLSAVQATWTAVTAAFQAGVVQPVQRAWEGLMGFLGSTIQTATTAIAGAWGRLAAAFNEYVISPVQTGWNAVVGVIRDTAAGVVNGVRGAWQGLAEFFRQAVVDPIRNVWQGMATFLPEVVNRAATALRGAFQSIVSGVRGAFQGVVNSIGNIINGIIGMVNRLIEGINKVRAAANLSAISRIPNVNIPSFATGGVVDRATLALVGEGGEREYIIPESKMAAASSRYLGGARGESVLPAAGGGGGTNQPPVINITTGPVMEMDGKRYVTIEEYQRGIRQTASQIYATLRTPQGRRAVGYA